MNSEDQLWKIELTRILPIIKLEFTKVHIYSGVNPDMTYKLFCQGLVDTIYPSKDLREISHFPANLKHWSRRPYDLLQVHLKYSRLGRRKDPSTLSSG